MKTSPAFFIARQLYITAKCTHEIPFFQLSVHMYVSLSLSIFGSLLKLRKKQKDDDDPRDYFKDNREDIYI